MAFRNIPRGTAWRASYCRHPRHQSPVVTAVEHRRTRRTNSALLGGPICLKESVPMKKGVIVALAWLSHYVVTAQVFVPPVFFKGSGGSSYSTGGGSAALTPPGTASDVRSRSFSGSDYFSSSGEMADPALALHLGNGVNPLTESSRRTDGVTEPTRTAGNEKSLVIQGGKVKPDGSFELSVKGPARVSFHVEVSTDGKTFSGLTQKGLSGSSVVSYSCDEKGQTTAIDLEAGQSPFRFYRLQVSDPPIAATKGN